MRVILLAFFVFAGFARSGQAKCEKDPTNPITIKSFIKKTPNFVLGKVIGLTPDRPAPEQVVAINIAVLKNLKGSIKVKEILGEYIYVDGIEGGPVYEVGKNYVFGIKSLKDKKVDLALGKCAPNITESDFKKAKR
ncbi:MAG: hypothetical protein V4736_07485 [Bdellovibrionota bacterium]